MSHTEGTSGFSIAEPLRDAVQLLLKDEWTKEGLSEIKVLLETTDDAVDKVLRLRLGRLAIEVARLVLQRSDEDRKLACRRELQGIQDELWALGRISLSSGRKAGSDTDKKVRGAGGAKPIVADVMDAVLLDQLLKHHQFEDGEIGTYIPIESTAIVKYLKSLPSYAERTHNSLKGYVSLAFGRAFGLGQPFSRYRSACRDKRKLLAYFLRNTGKGKAFSVGSLRDVGYLDATTIEDGSYSDELTS